MVVSVSPVSGAAWTGAAPTRNRFIAMTIPKHVRITFSSCAGLFLMGVDRPSALGSGKVSWTLPSLRSQNPSCGIGQPRAPGRAVRSAALGPSLGRRGERGAPRPRAPLLLRGVAEAASPRRKYPPTNNHQGVNPKQNCTIFLRVPRFLPDILVVARNGRARERPSGAPRSAAAFPAGACDRGVT
jgi:hypothetical protein